MTREEAFIDINQTQDYYVDELIKHMNDESCGCFKEVNFTSDTGTGKTKMMAKLANKMPEKFFLITTLSKGQLDKQIETNMKKDLTQDNCLVFGVSKYTANTRLTGEDILKMLPTDRDVIWLRDEGHIHTNKWATLLENRCWKVVNISATNKEDNGVRCNFTHTMMLRTVVQNTGAPEDALDKLIEVKKQHEKVNNYNPCAIVRSLDNSLTERVIKACQDRNLKCINITDEDYDMSDICKDDNEYDVIINKFKIVEGIDIRRAHVLYMSNEPSNPATTIQIIGRCRRNALLYRTDVDIFKNSKLLENTRVCYTYYNVKDMKIDSDDDGNLYATFCDKISCEKLKVGSKIKVKKGVMENGLTIIELMGETGTFTVEKDPNTGFNVVLPEGDFYKEEKRDNGDILICKIDSRRFRSGRERGCLFWNYWSLKDIVDTLTLKTFPGETHLEYGDFDYATGTFKSVKTTAGSFKGYDLGEKWEVINEAAVFTSYASVEETKQAFIREVAIPARKNVYWICSSIVNIDEINKPINTGYYNKYTQIVNDRESAIIGTDGMKQTKGSNSSGTIWVEDKAITNKVTKYSKLNTFITNKYASQIKNVKDELYRSKKSFDFDKKCNSCLGYCVEYYSKYLVYGEAYLENEILDAIKEAKITISVFNEQKDIRDRLIVRACILKYKEMMVRAYGGGIERIIPTIGAQSLIANKYQEFVDTVIKLGTQTADFVKKYVGDKEEYDPCLSIKHISGLADYISKDTIIDIKCTGSIEEKHIKQVLAYHYLSTKRSDLDIKRVIVYDAVNNKSVEIKIN